MEKKTATVSPVRAFFNTLGELPARMRRQACAFLVLLLMAAVVEALFAGSAALFISTISNPEAVSSSTLFARISGILGLRSLGGPTNLIWATAGLLLLLVVMKNVFSAVCNFQMARFSIRIEEFVGSRLLEGFFLCPYEWHMGSNSADHILAMQWANHMGNSLVFPFLKLTGDLLIVLVMLGTVFAVEPAASFVVFVLLGGLSVFVFWRIHRKLDRIAKSCRDIRLSVNREVTMAIHGLKDVRIAGREGAFRRKYTESMIPLSRFVALRTLFAQLPFNIVETIGVSIICCFVLVSFLYTGATATRVTGAVTLLAVTAWRVLPAMGRILSEFVKVRSSLPFVETELEYLSRWACTRGRSPDAQADEAVRFRDSFRFDNVSFRYEGAQALSMDRVSFGLDKGMTLGVIGSSGAGKSTLVDVLIGLLEPAEGEIVVDGVPLGPEGRSRWSRMFGYVPQVPYIADASLAENIAFGVDAGEIDRERVLECCRMASIDFWESLPDGIDSMIGERGAKLSGGQLQRVAIARALYNDPEILIFDEATSALDAGSERTIQKTIYSLRSSKTLIIVAHRLSTIEESDRIVWLENGTVRKIGSPKEVVPEYRRHNTGGSGTDAEDARR